MATYRSIIGPLLAAALIVARGEAAQTRAPEGRAQTAVFEPLVADPQEPQFFAPYLWERPARPRARLGRRGFRQTLRVAGGRDPGGSISRPLFPRVGPARAT